MSSSQELIFPDLIYLNEFDGGFEDYFQEVYEEFEIDFIKSKPIYDGKEVSAPRHPLVDDKFHKTFYHITHEGKDENSRTPDLRRMERIKFPKFFIENCTHEDFLVWENIRGRNTRVLIFNLKESYLTVLTKRKDYYMLCTAYLVEHKNRKKKLLKEYETYIKTKTA